MLASLSDDEGEPDDEEDDDYEGDDNSSDNCDEEDEEYVKDNGLMIKDSPTKPQCSAEVKSFISSPSVEKLLQLGETRTTVQQQVDASDPQRAADVFLQIASLYSDEPETKKAVLETIDAVLNKCLSGSALQSFCFLSTLLVMMGLLKGEEKMKKVLLVPGQLLCLEHAVQQEYFPQRHVSLFQTVLSKNSEALKSCSSAREKLSSALEERCHDEY